MLQPSSLHIISICLIKVSYSVFQIKMIMHYNSLKYKAEVTACIIPAWEDEKRRTWQNLKQLLFLQKDH
jgi:hypothetical protein